MLINKIVNNTHICFSMSANGITKDYGAKGRFNINHTYDAKNDENTLRVLEEDVNLKLAKLHNLHNFIAIDTIMSGCNKNSRIINLTKHDITFTLNTGFGKYDVVIPGSVTKHPVTIMPGGYVNIVIVNKTDEVGSELIYSDKIKILVLEELLKQDD